VSRKPTKARRSARRRVFVAASPIPVRPLPGSRIARNAGKRATGACPLPGSVERRALSDARFAVSHALRLPLRTPFTRMRS
jgi:hypothetical protein